MANIDELNANGLQTKDNLTLVNDLVTNIQNIYSQNGEILNLDSNTPDGQLIQIIAELGTVVRELITEVAIVKEIPFQRNALSSQTGTDTDAFAYSNAGVASALISLPLRYMHTTVEMVHKDDVENTIRLIYETILKIENNDTFSYFK